MSAEICFLGNATRQSQNQKFSSERSRSTRRCIKEANVAAIVTDYAEESSVDRLPIKIEMQQRIHFKEERCAEFEEIVGDSPALKAALDLVSMVAPTDSNVVIIGETGTGKELVACAIRSLSGRREYAFVKFNCAAIPLGLLESELFGHEKGAFTGAIAQKKGRFELANNGTLFLDEVGDIPLELQVKLLRVLLRADAYKCP